MARCAGDTSTNGALSEFTHLLLKFRKRVYSFHLDKDTDEQIVFTDEY